MRPLQLLGAALLLAACGGQAPAVAPANTAASAVAPAADLPPLTGRVVDEANLLSPPAEARLSEMSAQLEQRTTDQLVVVTLPDLHGRPIEQVGLAMGNGWGVGHTGKSNGVLLIVAPQEHKVRIEVGCGLEPILTDARAAEIIEQRIVPDFRDAQYEQGMQKGAEAIVQVLTRAAATPRIGGCRR